MIQGVTGPSGPVPLDRSQRAAAPLSVRIGILRATLIARIRELQASSDHHAAWVANLEIMREGMTCPEERQTQDRIIEAVTERADQLRGRLERVQHDLDRLEAVAPRVLADPAAPAGDLSRLLRAYAAAPGDTAPPPPAAPQTVTAGIAPHHLLPDPTLARFRRQHAPRRRIGFRVLVGGTALLFLAGAFVMIFAPYVPHGTMIGGTYSAGFQAAPAGPAAWLETLVEKTTGITDLTGMVPEALKGTHGLLK